MCIDDGNGFFISFFIVFDIFWCIVFKFFEIDFFIEYMVNLFKRFVFVFGNIEVCEY